MKQIFKYMFSALLCLISLSASADRVGIAEYWNGSVTYSIDGNEVTLTVVPNDDFYITADDILVEKAVDGGIVAQAPSLGPGISAPIQVTAVDVDDRGKGTYSFTLAEGYGAYVTVSFQMCLYIYPSVSLESWTYGQTPNEPVVTGNDGNAEVTFTYKVNGSDDYGPDVPTDAGAYWVKASVAAKGHYQAGSGTAFFEINPAQITEVILVESELTYTGLPQTAEVKAVKAGTLDVPETEYVVDVNSVVNADSYSVTVTGNVNIGKGGNFAGSATSWYSINRVPLTITAKSYTIQQGDELPDFEAEYEGFVNDETPYVLTTPPTLSSNAASDSSPGDYVIYAYGAEAQNYDISYVNGKLTITSPAVTIGDVNGDGMVDVADGVEIVNYILNNPSADFNAAAADVNHDGQITIADAVGVMNIILNK